MLKTFLLRTSSKVGFVTIGLMIAVPPDAGAQQVVEYSIPTAASQPQQIAAGADGALWFTEQAGNKIGRTTTAGVISEFSIPTPSSQPGGITSGPDGNLWFTEQTGNKIGKITTAGNISEFSLPTAGSEPGIIVVGSDGGLWFTEVAGSKIGRITTAGAVSEFSIPTVNSEPGQIVAGSDGNLWFTETNANIIGRITTAGVIKEFVNPNSAGAAHDLVAGPDGSLYFTEAHTGQVGVLSTDGVFMAETAAGNAVDDINIGPDAAIWIPEPLANKIARLNSTATGLSVTEFALPTELSRPLSVAAGSDGNVWFTEQDGNNIGRLIPPASPTVLVAAVLPSSRSVQVGATATAFATIINSGATSLQNCRIVPMTAIPAGFTFQATNSSTNAAVGEPNTPVSIAAGAPQSFIMAFPVNASFIPTDVVLGFDCAGRDPAQPIIGLNTLLLSGSSSPVPDVVALGATLTSNGIVDIPGPTGSSAFAVATVNVGAAGAITVSVDTGLASLPLTFSICQTNPVTAACLSPPAPTVAATIAANATPTFSVFVTSKGAIAFSPARSRISVRFKDAAGATRGSTSVAVETK